MRMIQFQGNTSQEVISRIRRELGPNALIVSTTEENGQIVILAAIDRHLQPLCAQETFSEIKKCMMHHRTPRPVIDHLLSNSDLEGSLPEVLARLLRLALPVPSLHTILNEGAPVMLIGPPGVGKTVALAKLAAQCVMESRPVKVISTDRQKSGASDQIESLCEALEAPLSIIENPMLLHRAIEDGRQQHLLLIDTPGINPFNPEECNRLQGIVQAAKAQVFLVMPARGDHEFCEEVEDAFSVFNPNFLLLTQLDLQQRLGNVLTRALDSQYPLIAVGHHAEIGNLLVPVTSSSFSKLFIDAYDAHVQQSLLQPQLLRSA